MIEAVFLSLFSHDRGGVFKLEHPQCFCQGVDCLIWGGNGKAFSSFLKPHFMRF